MESQQLQGQIPNFDNLDVTAPQKLDSSNHNQLNKVLVKDTKYILKVKQTWEKLLFHEHHLWLSYTTLGLSSHATHKIWVSTAAA